MAIEIVDLPIKKMVMFESFLLVYGKVTHPHHLAKLEAAVHRSKCFRMQSWPAASGTPESPGRDAVYRTSKNGGV